MLRLKPTILATIAAALIACLPMRPAAAAGPLLFAPWALGHIVLPLIAASVAASAQPQAPYPPGPGYYAGAPGYYAPPNYYARPPSYFGSSQGYYPAPQAYYRPALAYAAPMPRFYAPTHGYYGPRASYAGSYGAQVFYRSGGFAYRRR